MIEPMTPYRMSAAPNKSASASDARWIAVPPGSYLAISTSAGDLLGPEALRRLQDTWKGSVQQQLTFRDREQVARFFAGTDLVEPGLVPVDEWRAQPGTTGKGNSAMWAAVGRKR
jgi:hypothetical protein